ncbi:MBL fold metallo-hydrolase [Tabrizicola sp.]|uniref:MBL fold metallo-hydrolase n=1 Tax=Tabrizicola sp. TaxID=2005166 RepID=UPI003F33213E
MTMPAQRTTIRLDRRKFLAAASALVAAGVLPKSALALSGPHSFTHGTFNVMVLSDGTLELPLSIISADAPPEELAALLGLAADAQAAPAEISPVLVTAGSDAILFDTGTGGMMGPNAGGQLVESVKAAGLTADAITKVIFTHAHPDHLWGTIAADGTHVFPNASYHLAEAELNFWSAPDLATQMPADMTDMINNTQKQLTAMKDKIVTFKPGSEVVPGIAAIDTAGHTPGHVSFELAGGDGLILTGDAITVPAVFFAHPEWKFGFDADGEMAGKSRRALLDMAAAGKKQMLGYHWAFPGLGRAEAKDGAFVYVAS